MASRTHRGREIPVRASRRRRGSAAQPADPLVPLGPGARVGIADDLRLDTVALRTALAEARYRDRIQQQFDYARAAGITGVPAYVAGGYLLVGAQPYEMFCKLIETANADDAPTVSR